MKIICALCDSIDFFFRFENIDSLNLNLKSKKCEREREIEINNKY